MFQDIIARTGDHPNVAWRGRFADACIELCFDGESQYLSYDAHGVRIGPNRPDRRITFRLEASGNDWRELITANPRPGLQSLSAMRRTGHLKLTGDHVAFYQNLLPLELLFSMSRPRPTKANSIPPQPTIDPIVGRYINLAFEGRPHRIYFEEAGSGIPLICLHTAGADGRQYRAILNDEAITENFRVVVFDLPWHGKSSPPPGFQDEIYELSTERYVAVTMAVKEALQLDNPVIMGCSIGGRAVLHLALRHGRDLRAVIGLQSALYAENRIDGEPEGLRSIHRPDVHGPEISGALMMGLIAPQSNGTDTWETLWHYMQGGPGVFMGDLNYYFTDGDMRNGVARGIDTAECPVHLLTGEYDTSATPELSGQLAEEINATSFKVMKGMGHFPMSENPEEFRKYLLPVLEQIAA
ncbi:MAG: 2-succinyl-6-hydroxy-2,4-cyclohexadiene-1-carboxylate synthase [Alphaproteobacteria bacterium MarineAlpha1_Bin1]|nr:MAG: 2-succinyl-6-hydroxy-2,4-cyclohexadiene-1-carboxylate synthase [Alphaproteobacteria bacterium MarineAlpha1_Bin1]